MIDFSICITIYFCTHYTNDINTIKHVMVVLIVVISFVQYYCSIVWLLIILNIKNKLSFIICYMPMRVESSIVSDHC